MIEWSRIDGTSVRAGSRITGLGSLQGELARYRIRGGTQINFADLVADPTP